MCHVAREYLLINETQINDYLFELLGDANFPSLVRIYLEALAVHYNSLFGDRKLSLFGISYTHHLDELRQVILNRGFRDFLPKHKIWDARFEKNELVYATIEVEGEAIYSGTMKGVVADGFGRITWLKSKKYYIGTIKDGFPEGVGICVWPNGCIYYGGYNKGHVHGKGRLFFADGQAYEGNFTHGCSDGFAVVLDKDKKVREGVYINVEGPGVITPQRISDIPRPAILDDNSQVNQLLIELFDRYKQSDGTFPSHLEIKSRTKKCRKILLVNRDSILYEDIEDIYARLQNKKNMFCVIKLDDNLFALHNYDDGIFKLENFEDPTTRVPLRIKFYKNLYVGEDLIILLKEILQPEETVAKK